MIAESLNRLMLVRYEVHVRALRDAVLPPFLGSALRGAWGHALKAVACSMPHGDCGRCLLVERCLYPRLFETSARSGKELSESGASNRAAASEECASGRSGDRTARDGSSGTGVSRNGAFTQGQRALLKKRQDAPRPFIFIPPIPGNENGFMRARDDLLRWRVRVNAGEPVVFGLSLIGDAINDLPYVVYAISLMAQHGFGAERASFALERVAALDAEGHRTIVYTAESTRIEEHASCLTTLGALTQARLNRLAIADCQLPIAASATATAKALAATAHGSESTLTAGSQIRNENREIGSEPTDSAMRRRPSAIDSEAINSPIGNSPIPNSTIRDSPLLNSQSAIRNEVTLRFLTPTRMRLKGRVIENPSFTQLISSLSLRLSMLAETFADAPLSYDYKAMIERAREVTTRDSTLRLMALDRYSNRRGGKLELDGFMGEVAFAGPAIQDLLPLLVAGEFLHVGSGTAFGLGRYLIVS